MRSHDHKMKGRTNFNVRISVEPLNQALEYTNEASGAACANGLHSYSNYSSEGVPSQ